VRSGEYDNHTIRTIVADRTWNVIKIETIALEMFRIAAYYTIVRRFSALMPFLGVSSL
jgi:hypothetical protein